jgi:hypothetical protein
MWSRLLPVQPDELSSSATCMSAPESSPFLARDVGERQQEGELVARGESTFDKQTL